METYILLFRGINVGGKNLLPMKDLIALLEGAGYSNVKTYIQSGNVVLQSETNPTDGIAKSIEDIFGFKPVVIVFESSRWVSVVSNNPFNVTEGKNMHFYLPNGTLNADIDRLTRLAATTEKYEIVDNVFYLHAPDGIGRSKLVAQVEACLGVPVTGRNYNTVKKLLVMSQSSSATN